MTAINTTDADYWNLSDRIYDDKYLKPGANFRTQDALDNSTQDIKDNHNWKTVESIDDPNSDLQAAMVVPADEYDAVVNHNQQPSQAIFVSRGTSSGNDWKTNVNELALGSNSKINQYKKNQLGQYSPNNNWFSKAEGNNQFNENPVDQFSQYDKFVNDNLNKYKPKEYSFTGHSLGGALATYQAVQHDAPATTFAGANPFKLLTEQQQKDATDGKYNDKIKNYRHYGDIVPNVPWDNEQGMQTVGTQVFASSSIPNLSFKAYDEAKDKNLVKAAIIGAANEYAQHTSVSWDTSIFNSDGSIKILPSKYASFNPENLNDFEKMLAATYASEGGSSSDKIKISPEDVNILASLLINIVENEISTFVSQTNANAKTEFEDNYNFKKIASYIAPDLSDREIDDCLFDAGVTYQSMVEAPKY